jgi:hypothetical protein
MGNRGSRRRQSEEKDSIEIYETDSDAEFTKTLKANLQRLIMYAQSADVVLQREVAERLANEAVKPSRQVQIVQLGGLQLLLPLTRSLDSEVRK